MKYKSNLINDRVRSQYGHVLRRTKFKVGDYVQRHYVMSGQDEEHYHGIVVEVYSAWSGFGVMDFPNVFYEENYMVLWYDRPLKGLSTLLQRAYLPHGIDEWIGVIPNTEMEKGQVS